MNDQNKKIKEKRTQKGLRPLSSSGRAQRQRGRRVPQAFSFATLAATEQNGEREGEGDGVTAALVTGMTGGSSQ